MGRLDMPKDRFQNFAQLEKELVSGVDYKIVVMRRAPVAIIAPHGGKIEIGTSEIARAIAGDNYSLYLFEGLKSRPHHEIHITSHKFDEPRCVNLVSQCDIVLTVHGRKDAEDKKTVYLGGLDAELRNEIARRLVQVCFPARCICCGRYSGTHRKNICNRGRREAGVQMELPRTLRDNLCANPSLLAKFSKAVRDAIARAG